MIGRALAGALLVLPGVSAAQALQCSAPASVPRPHPELPSAENPARRLPIGSYTLAVIWVPEFCHGHSRDADAAFECGTDTRFGFALHGLWPDGVGPEWPQYCTAAALLPPATLKRNLCFTPSAQLLQHEWAKHGTCTSWNPDQYFARSTGLYAKLVFPDMSERETSAGALAAAIAGANPGLRADMIRVTANRSGWLDELWFCLDRQLAYTRCKPNSGGVAPETRIRIAPVSAR